MTYADALERLVAFFPGVAANLAHAIESGEDAASHWASQFQPRGCWPRQVRRAVQQSAAAFTGAIIDRSRNRDLGFVLRWTSRGVPPREAAALHELAGGRTNVIASWALVRGAGS